MANPRIFHLLHLSHRAIFRAADRVLMDRFGITAGQNAVLLYLLKQEGAVMGAVAVALGLKNAAISGLVDRMEQKDLVERKPSTSDGRAYELYLKPYGREIAEKSKAIIKASNDYMLDGFDNHKRDTIINFLETIIERAENFGSHDLDDEGQQP